MSPFTRFAARLFAVVAVAFTPVLASAGTTSVQILIDKDNSASTGCSVSTGGGVFTGVDQIVTTTVDDVTRNVTGVVRQECIDPAGGVFGSPITVDAGGWGTGSDPNTMFIETHVPYSALGFSSIPFNMHLGFIVTSGTVSDFVLSNGTAPILFPRRPPRHRVVGDPPDPTITLDGLSPDWVTIPPIHEGPGSVGSPVLRFSRIQGFANATQLFFAFTVPSNANAPTAVDDNYSVQAGHTLVVPAPGVLANDTDPRGFPLTAHLVGGGPQHGTLTLNLDGSFTYVNDGSSAPVDSFDYKANDGELDSNTAHVTINITPAPPLNHAPAFTSAATTSFTVGVFGSFTITTTGTPDPVVSESGALPSGVTFTPHAGGTATLEGTPALGTQGTYPLVLTATNVAGTATQNFTLVVNCGALIVHNPANNTATAGTPFSATFTQTGASGTPTFTTTSTLPTGITLSTTGVLSGTPTQTGTFPIVVKVTDSTGCTGTGPTYNLIVSCQTITVTNPATNTATAGSPFSATFTQTGAIGGATFTTASALPSGLTLATNGTLSGTPTVVGSFPIVVKATDANGCSGTGSTYTLTIGCPTITVTNPGVNSGVANSAFSVTFTESGGVGTTTFSLASGTLPAGLALASNGQLAGTPTQTGTFPITVKATDANGCTGTGPTYTLTITCQTITVNNPATNSGTVNAAFSQTFTATNAIGTTTFTTASTLPNGLTLATNGTLSGTPTQTGTFNIVVTAHDANGCTGTGATYALTINCQTITVTNPGVTSGTVGTPFSQTFTQSGAFGTATFTTASALPNGITLATSGTLSGTPTQTGSFPIVVKVTDSNGCTGTGATYTLVINCQTITVTNPSTTSGTAGAPFSQTFTQSGAQGSATFSTASTLPNGLTLSSAGVLSGTPTQTGSFPIVVKVTDSNGCTGTGATYNLVINCQTITVTNPVTNSGVANSAFSVTFTQTGAIGGATFSLNSGTLPAGLVLASNGQLSGTPTQVGSFPITVKVTDGNGCTGVGVTYTLTISCQTITVNNPATTTGTANTAFSQQFTASNTIGATAFTLASGTLPTGLTLAGDGTLSGTPTQTGTFNITVTATDANGCSGTGATYSLVIGCQTITVNNPGTTTGTVSTPFSVQFTASNTIGATTFSTASTLPTGLTLHADGTLDGTPMQTGSFDIVVHVVDSNGCSANGATYTLVISCQTITVTNPSTTTGTTGTAFSQQFTQSGAVGGATFTTASTLPNGLTLHPDGTLDGTPTQTGSFDIVVTVTDGNSCTGTGATYTLVISCGTVTVTNPGTSSFPSGSPMSVQFTQTGGNGTLTWSESGALPAGLTFHTTTGVLDGTPTSGAGTFPITVSVTDANGCQGTGAQYNLTITCPIITVTNPSTTTGTAGTAFSQQFTQSGGQGTITWSTGSTLPTGFTLNTSTGVLSGTTHQTGTFNITVTATDSHSCQGTGSQYSLVISCQTVTVTNPGVNTGTVDAAFSQTFTVTGILDTVTWSETGALPAGITLDPATGVLSGTPTEKGTFPITVKATDTNGCFGTSNYTLTINCQTITVTNPGVNTGTVDSPFSQTFTQSGAHGTATFAINSGTLPAGLSLSTAGVLSGTPTQAGSFPITVKVTDANGCTGTGATYNLTINCQTITVNNPANSTGTVGVAFSEQFTQTGAHGTATFSTASTLPTGFTLASDGTLSGTTTQHGTFPIVVKVTDSNGCTGTGATYNLTINCQTITVTNPATTTGTVGTPFSQQFTQSGGNGATTFSTASTLPTGLTLHSATGILDGTPTQAGTFNITVTATDANGCTGSGPTYTLIIVCNVITVNNPATTTGTAGTAFSQQFTQSGGNGTIVWSESGTLPTGFTFNTSTGVLSGTTHQVGTFNITVTATDANGCQGSGPQYSLVISCQTINITNPATTSGTAGQAFTATFTASGILDTPTWSETGTLPTGITLNASTGVLSGTTHQVGSFPITVKVTDTNGCFATSNYTLTIVCQTITVTNPATTTGLEGNTFSQTFTATGILDTATWSTTSTLPTGLTLNPSTGVLSGTPSQVGTFPIVVKVTDTNGCSGTGSTYSLVLTCPTITVSGTIPAQKYNTAISPTVTFSQTGTSTTITWSATGLPTGVTINSSTGVVSGTPSVTGTFSVTIKATDVAGCFGTKSQSLVVAPIANADTYSGGVDNVQFVITGGSTASPATPFVGSAFTGRLIVNDQPSGGVSAVAGTFATTNGGSVTIAADGTFIYTPKANPGAAANTSDTFNYTVTSDTGGTGTPATSAAATVTINMAGRVWWVKNNYVGPPSSNGQSQAPFNNTSSLNAAIVASDIIFVYKGDGTTTNLTSAVTLKTSNQLLGEAAGLTVNGTIFFTSSTNFPILGCNVTLASSDTVNGIDMSTGSTNAITAAGVTGDTVTIRNLTTTTGQAFSFTGTNNSGTANAITVSTLNIGTSGGGPNKGVSINNYKGTVTFNGGTIQKTTARGVEFITVANGGATSVTISGMTFTNATTADGADPTVTTGTCGTLAGGGDNTGCNAPIFLDTVSHASITGTTVNGSTQMGINVHAGDTLTLTNDTITACGNGTNEYGIKVHNLTGTQTWTNVNVHDNNTGLGGQVWVESSNAGAALNLTASSCQFTNASQATGGNLFIYAGYNSSSDATLTFNTCTFSGSSATALAFHPQQTSGNASLTVTGGTFTLNNNHIDIAKTNSATVTWDLENISTMTGANFGEAINLYSGNPSSGTMSGTINNVVIGTSGVIDSGCAGCKGIEITTQSNGTLTATITNNSIHGTNGGIEAFGAQANTGSSRLNLTITGNTIDAPPALSSNAAIFAETSTSSTGGRGTVCATIGGSTAGLKNNINGDWANNTSANPIFVRLRFSGDVFALPGFGGSGSSASQVATFIAGNNNFSNTTGETAGATLAASTSFTGTCPP